MISLRRFFCCSAALVCLVISNSCRKTEDSVDPESPIQVIGLTTERMNFHAADQESANWCWAACTQMVLSSHGVTVSQSEIVKSAFGVVADRPGSAIDVMKQLDECPLKDGCWELETLLGAGPPSFELMHEQFERETPLIAMLENPGQAVGHAVVITAVIYDSTPTGPEIIKVVIRDPDPRLRNQSGKRELSSEEFGRIMAYLLVLPVRAQNGY